MIAYDLKCGNGHTFEGWFKDHKAYKKQEKNGLVSCPVCDDTNVVRVPSTFAIKGKPESPPSDSPQVDPAVVHKAIRHYVETNFDNVGPDFAKEALKIHYGVSPPRNIRGSSTDQEEETLRKEGIEFFKVPVMDPSTPSSDSDA